jgi:acetate kinase
MDACILTINGGSSSLKFAVFRGDRQLTRALAGRFERIGTDGAELVVNPGDGSSSGAEPRRLALPDHSACVPVLIEVLHDAGLSIGAIGHRVVHGGVRYRAPERVTADVLTDLRALIAFAPEHQPAEIALMEAFAREYPNVAQVACFDTAFHADLPRVAQLLPIPRRYAERGVRRYGFHGISYTYLMGELARLAGAAAAQGRVVLAHLGNGASMAAVHRGRCIDTTMAFTPTAGLVMGTRSGDLDPGLPGYLSRADGTTADEFDTLVNRASGLLGLSERSGDVRDLLAREASDVRAAEALAVYCYHPRANLRGARVSRRRDRRCAQPRERARDCDGRQHGPRARHRDRRRDRHRAGREVYRDMKSFAPPARVDSPKQRFSQHCINRGLHGFHGYAGFLSVKSVVRSRHESSPRGE